MDILQKNRARIDKLDARLAELYEARMAAAAEIAAWKREQGLPIRDPARERELKARNLARISDPALREGFASVLDALLDASRRRQRQLMGEEPPSADPIRIERGLLSRTAELLPRDRRVFLVTDAGIPTRYVQALADRLPGCLVHTVPCGEGSKSPETLRALLEAMLAAGLTRRDCVLGLGGGVVGDLAGFAAAIYLRGIAFYSVPTTLLAMVDSSVGGKTGINLSGVKNAVGAFSQPRAVWIDPDVLDTLPRRQISNGLAEVLKMALCLDADLFTRLESGEPIPPEELIVAALGLKTAIVEADEREADLRRVLNFGHTLGHGIEAARQAAAQQTVPKADHPEETALTGAEAAMRADLPLLHGECVALGMLPMCAPEVRQRLLPVLERLGLPTKVAFDPDAALAAVAHDKKGTGDGITVVTVPEIGAYRFESAILPELRARLESLRL